MFIKSIPALKEKNFTLLLRMVVCIPSGITEVKMRAVRIFERVNGKEVYFIHEPMAAAIGIGIDIMQPKGNMIVDIGGGTTEIAVIALAELYDKSVKLLTILQMTLYIICVLNTILFVKTTAEKIKIQIGKAKED
jgi:rod shape-determining protein MreB